MEEKAKKKAPKTEDAEAVFEKLIRDRLYFRDSGGGITLSGGKP